MKVVLTSLCAGAVLFMLRFLAALLKEGRSQSLQPLRVYFARFNPAKRRGELMIMNSRNDMHKSAAEMTKRAAFIVVAAALLTLPMHGQHTPTDAPAVTAVPPNQQASVANQQTQQEIVEELAAMKKRIEQLETALKQHEVAEQPTTVVHSAKASAPVGISPSTAITSTVPPEAQAALPQAAPPTKPAKAEPFAFADWTWLNGNSRVKEPPFDTKFFTPEVQADVDYIVDFNHPKDDTIGGSSEVFRAYEVQLTQLGVGGDFHFDNVRGRLMTQFGMYSQTTPRNDASPSRGQWQLDNAYRYVSEAYGGYHFNVLHGVNVDAGIFMSYVGLFSYYNFDNWAYQPSYVSSNTPWFFTGVRTQIYLSEKLKVEPWFINGWQTYGKPNGRPGIGGQIKWAPNGWMTIISNNYGVGSDDVGFPTRRRIHTDDSLEVKYFDNKEHFFDKAAFTATFDLGCEYGGGVSCYGNRAGGPKQSFVGGMFYNRVWFHNDLFALTIGGGAMNNPGRYLTLLPPINGATEFSGTPYFTQNPGDKFKAWDASVTFDWRSEEHTSE